MVDPGLLVSARARPFTYLVVFACACLAAFGLQALTQRRLRLVVALVGGVPGVALLAALLALMPTWRDWLLADPARAHGVRPIRRTWPPRAQYPIDPQLVVGGLLSSLDFGQSQDRLVARPAGADQPGLRRLAGAGSCAGPHSARACSSALLAVDLLVFASDFHPRAPLASLTPASAGGRTRR